VTFHVPQGSLLALVGPSGCGKTTLLKVLGGYLQPSAGQVRIAGEDVTTLPPERRGAGMVFQSFALFPHLTAWKNVAFGLEVRGLPVSQVRERVSAMLRLVGLTAEEAQRLPSALSGGQQQRVALARALVIQPRALLLDEPLANLDRPLREALRGELRAILSATRVTALLVTHDPEEALSVADLVGVLGSGRLLQVGPPQEVYHRPACPIVARSLGQANLMDASLLGLSSDALVLIRPEKVTVTPEGEPPSEEGHSPPSPALSFAGRCLASSFLGPSCLVEVDCGRFKLLARSSRLLAPASRVTVRIPSEAAWPLPRRGPS
jgi:ABC-type Fe3+/spermidine/putrescine transport system ATPase subunit